MCPHNRSFLIVGGWISGHSYRNKIFQFDPDSLGWVERQETLTQPVALPFVALVEDEMVECD